MNSNKRLLIVVPAFNEEDAITETIRRLKQTRVLLEASGLIVSICVVDDGSTDDTQRLAREEGADSIVKHRVNQGLGAAVRSGIHFAREQGYDLLVKFDADLQHDPNDIPSLIQPILNDEADVVYGNRFPGIDYTMPPIRKVGNWVFTTLVRFLTGWPVKDSQPGIFAINKEYIDVADLPGDYNYAQQVLLDANLKYMRFAHVPVAFHKRKTGVSFVSLKYPFKVIPQMLLVVASTKPMSIFVPLGLAFMLFGALVFCAQFAQWLTGSTARPVENVNLVLGSGLFGVQTLFFGLLAQLIVQTRKK